VARVFSGIQPSGEKHLGNYLGAIRGWVDAQRVDDSFFCIVDLHALTGLPDPGQLREDTRRVAALLLAAGLDPDRATIFVQSQVPAHAELCWILSCLASTGELRRMTQFKARAGATEHASAALFGYPVLQAADILLYGAQRVPVGADQRQHLELARDLALRFNRRYGEVFTIPGATLPATGARVMDLQAPGRKMSTTGGTPLGTLFLLDTADVIRRKVRAAVTDPESEVRAGPDKPGVSNLLGILAAVTGRPLPALEAELAGRGYSALKDEVADALVALLTPIHEAYDALAGAGFAEVERVLGAGAARAQAVAAETIARAKAATGLRPAVGPVSVP
jgi:tryptophanyl-tRNA synthetase